MGPKTPTLRTPRSGFRKNRSRRAWSRDRLPPPPRPHPRARLPDDAPSPRRPPLVPPSPRVGRPRRARRARRARDRVRGVRAPRTRRRGFAVGGTRGGAPPGRGGGGGGGGGVGGGARGDAPSRRDRVRHPPRPRHGLARRAVLGPPPPTSPTSPTSSPAATSPSPLDRPLLPRREDATFEMYHEVYPPGGDCLHDASARAKAPCALLLNPTGGSALSWILSGAAKHFQSRGFRVVLCDLRGQGRTGAPRPGRTPCARSRSTSEP